jgi:hypothetical protein
MLLRVALRRTCVVHAILARPSMQLLGRARQCPSRSYLSASTTCGNTSLAMGPVSGSQWVLQRSQTVPGAFLIQFMVRAMKRPSGPHQFQARCSDHLSLATFVAALP